MTYETKGLEMGETYSEQGVSGAEFGAEPPVEPAGLEPAAQPAWTAEQLRNDPAFSEWFDANVAPGINAQVDRLIEQLPVTYAPGELDGWMVGLEREERFEAAEQREQSLGEVRDVIDGWQGELGQLDADQVIGRAGALVAAAQADGFPLTDEDVMIAVRHAAEEHATQQRGMRVVTDQIDREGRLLGLNDDERAQVFDLAEQLLPAARRADGVHGDADAARVAITEAARAIAGRTDPGRAVPQDPTAISRYYGEQGRKLWDDGRVDREFVNAVQRGPVDRQESLRSIADRYAAQARELGAS